MNLLCIFLLLAPRLIYTKEVSHVHVIYRHGDRAPEKILTDSNRSNVNFWPAGLGQLTDNGIRQQFVLGQWIRDRYKNLLSPKYSYREILVRSTDVERTLMSAQANLAGLYYNGMVQIIPNVSWRPIPVHIVPEKYLHPFKCKAFNHKLNLMYKSTNYKSLFTKYDKTLDNMRIVSKNPKMQIQDTWEIFDNMFCEKVHNITSESWVTKEIYSNISKIYELNWKLMFEGEEFGRLSGGRFLEEIILQLKNVTQNYSHVSEKMRMYSVHDTTLAALTSAIGINNGTHPQYASCLMIELIRKADVDSSDLRNWIVKVFYKTGPEESSTTLPETKIKGCKSDPCNLRDFIDYSKPRRMDHANYQRLCANATSPNITPFYGLVLVVMSMLRLV